MMFGLAFEQHSLPGRGSVPDQWSRREALCGGSSRRTASSAASQRECSSGGNHVECDASVATDRTRRRGFAMLITVTLTLTYFTFKQELPAANTNKIELTVGKGEPLRVSFVGDSMDYGLFATKPALGFHELMVGMA